MVSLSDEREVPQAGAAPSLGPPLESPGIGATAIGPWSRSHRRLTAGILLTNFAWAFEALAVATVLPATVDDLGGLPLYGWTFGAFLLTNLLVIAAAGGEIDRLGPTRPFLLGIALFVAGLLLGGFAPSMVVLIGARAVQGLGSGILAAVTYVVVARGYPESVRPRMLALMASAWVIPGLVGPAVAGLIADTVGWRWVFFGIVPLPLLACVLALPSIRRLPAVAEAAAPEWDRLWQAVLLGIGMTMLLAGLGRAEPWQALLLVAVGAVATLAALRRLLPPGTLRAAPGAAAAVAAMGLFSLAFFGVELFVPLALTDLRGQSSAIAGLSLTASALTWTAGAWVLERRASRASRRAMVRLGLILIALGVAGVAVVLVPGTPVLIVPLAWAVAGLGIGLAYSTVQLVVLETAPAGGEGRATAAMQISHTAGIALATGIGGVLVASFGAGEEASPVGLAVQGLLMLAAVALGVGVAGRLPGRPSEPAPTADLSTGEFAPPERRLGQRPATAEVSR